jgi:uncharacterized protein YqeY|tara:strand:- start:143 stop:604 length:462 start_codon:yes stop_codon:yes gene_type:complete
MSLKEKIQTKYKNSLKSKDKMGISTYRLILSSIKDLDIANRSGPDKKETDDEGIKKLLKKMLKQRTESIEIYTKNNRKDLLDVEQKEFDLLSSFLPQQLNEEETKKICIETISKLGAESIKDMGKVIGELKKNYPDNLDFAKAGPLLKELLNK